MHSEYSDAYPFPIIYDFSRGEEIPEVTPVVIAPFGRHQDIPIIAPASVSNKTYDFLDKLYKPLEDNQSVGSNLRIFHFDSRIYVMVVFITTAFENSSGRSGLRIAIGAGISQDDKEKNGRLVSAYLEMMFNTINRNFSASLPSYGSEKIIEAVNKIEVEPAAVEPFYVTKDVLIFAAQSLECFKKIRVRAWPFNIRQSAVKSRMPKAVIYPSNLSSSQLLDVVLGEILLSSNSSTVALPGEGGGEDRDRGSSVCLISSNSLPKDVNNVKVKGARGSTYLVLY